MLRSLTVAFCLLAAPVLAQTQADPEAATGLTAKPLVTAQDYMIVAAHPRASQAGADVLAAGGSAADAAIATLLVLNVVEPQSSGIGGGAFALVHGPDGLTSWDARETAPAGATPDMFLRDGEPMPFLQAVASGRSVGVPGLVRLMEALHARHGKLRWADLFQRAIDIARDGFPVSPRMAASIESSAGRLAEADAGQVFLPDGAAPAEGVVFKQPALAATLEAIAAEGADGFYSGPVAEQIVAAVTAGDVGGSMTLQDLADYQVVERPAVCHAFKLYRICGMGPPSSGATTVGQILMLLDRFKPSDWALEEDRLWHLFAEASRLAYADRARYLADSDFVKVPIAGLLDPSYMDQRARLIPHVEASTEQATAGDPPWREGHLYAPDLQEDLPGTTHLSVIDGDGLAISLTASIETAFGSGRMAAGFLLNNQLTDFSFRPAAEDGRPIANAIAAGKRPRSSMAPTMVYQDDALVVLAGSPGGSRIPEYVAQSLLAVLGFDLDPAEAAALPHVSHRNRGGLAVEPEIGATIRDGLAARGHQVEERPMTSGLHLIRIGPNGVLEGGADPRREGVAIGR
ncbi:MAG: gamma-glutamyltransferase [Pseudomonadota bacterium]